MAGCRSDASRTQSTWNSVGMRSRYARMRSKFASEAQWASADAVRRLAYEAADGGLLSADLAAGIRRVKGVKKVGVRLGNWLTAEQGQRLWQAPDKQRLKGKRDRALLALLLACGLRRHEAVTLTLDHLQQWENHWAIVDLVGKAGHVRTIPMPGWVKCELEDWLRTAAIDRRKLFRRVNKVGKAWGDGMTEKSVRPHCERVR
jgi:integrase